MEITKETILKNMLEAIDSRDYYIDDQEKGLLKEIIEEHFFTLCEWSFNDYSYFAGDVRDEGFRHALREYELLTPGALGLPSSTELPLDDLNTEDLEDAINERLAEKFDYCNRGFNYEINEDKQVVFVTNIEWDLS